MAKARTLYVSRPLVNVDDLRGWASEQGFELCADPHVTIAFSKKPIVWHEDSGPLQDELTAEGGSRSVGGLGAEGATVLRFEDDALTQRWRTIKDDAGASWDYDEYLPHVTLTYEATAPDKIEPYDGPLVFGPERWEEIKPKEERMAADGFYVLAQDSETQIGPFPTVELASRAADLLADPLPSGVAYDKESVRVFDADGRMRVVVSPISKATVNPYLGHEIPGHEELGLVPTQIYMLLRDPDELRKAAPTFNGIPVLVRHEAVSAADPKRDIIGGCTGTDAKFEAPYLYNSLSVWTDDAIAGIEDRSKCELSSAYRYTPDMTPGTWEGQKYDGIMRDIVGNHVALVEKGRAGPDVVVGDSAIETQREETDMKNKHLSRTALRVSTALAAVIAPKIAADKALDLTAVVKGVTRKTLMAKDGKSFDATKLAAIVKLARDAAEPLLAPEAKAAGGIGPDDIIMHLLQAQAPAVAAEPPELDEAMPAAAAPAASAAAAGQAAKEPMGGDNCAQVLALLEGKVAPELLAQVQALLADEGAAEEAVEAVDPAAAGGGEDPPGEDEDDNPAEGGKEKDEMVSKKAMDAAIKASSDETAKRVRAENRATQDAVAFVRPWVGDSSVAFDSALDVYTSAVKALKVENVEGVKDVAALRAIISAQPKPGSAPKRYAQDSIAMDAAAEQSLAERFPHAARIVNLG